MIILRKFIKIALLGSNFKCINDILKKIKKYRHFSNNNLKIAYNLRLVILTNPKLFMRKILFVKLAAILIATGNLMAQDRALSRTFNDENGQRLPSMNILLKGTNRGTNSDGDGAFKRSVPVSRTLVFSSVGYKTKKVAFNSSSSQVNVSIHSDVRTARVFVSI